MRLDPESKKLIDIWKLVDKVKFELHSTSIVPFRIEKSKAFRDQIGITYVGWGSYDIPITIYFKEKAKLEPLILTHYLCFERPGEWRNCKFKINKQRLRSLR